LTSALLRFLSDLLFGYMIQKTRVRFFKNKKENTNVQNVKEELGFIMVNII
jgi:hypothetical protein